MPVLPPDLQTTQRSGAGTWSAGGQLQQISEYVPELRWPNSVSVYERMRRDAKCAGVLRAASLPIRGTGWHVVDSPDVNPDVAQFVRNQLGLNEPGDSRQRRRGQGISWDKFLQHQLLMMPFGHMFFEPVFQIGQPGPNDTGLPPGQYAHLARMAPVLPATISGMNISADGELASIEQFSVGPNGQSTTIALTRDQIVPFVLDREGSDWAGTSLLREAYKHWFMKDQLERLAVQIVERNGMGLPVAKYGDDGDRNQMLRMMTAARAGEQSGVAIRQQDDFALVGVTGSLVDPLPHIAYHGQEIAGSVLAMFLTLGHDTGARSLGETFVDYFTLAIKSIIADLEETNTEDVSRMLVELNFGPDEAYPEIKADSIIPQAPLTAEAIAALVTAGAITPDPSLDEFARHQFGMPPPTPQDETAAEPNQTIETIAVSGSSSSHSGRPSRVSRVETLDQSESRLARLRESVFRRRGR
jgi:hypothetical protein